MTGSKKAIRTPVETSNRFAALEDMESEETGSGSQNTASASSNRNNIKKFLPLIMHGNVQDHKKFISLIKAIVKEKFHIKYSEGTVSVHLQTLLDYENLKSIWKERGINFHTYTRKDKKKRVYVLNGLHNEVTAEDVQDELKEAGINIMNMPRVGTFCNKLLC